MDNQEKIRVTFHPDNKTAYTYLLPDVVNISESTINKDLAEHSSKYLWFASLSARLMAKRDNMSQSLKTLMANVQMNYRDLAKKSGDKTTEGLIQAQVDSDSEVVNMRSLLSEAEAELNMCNTIKDAFYHRQSCLVALGANMREEMKSLQTGSMKG